MNNNKIFITAILLFAFSFTINAQEDRSKSLMWSTLHGWEYKIKAGFNIGGTSPIPLPQEIREINSFKPSMAISIEGDATKWVGETRTWGFTLGLRLENKGMTTDATVKNYGMKIINANGGTLEGIWTGNVKTKVKNSYLTVPVLVNYQLSKRWQLSAGPYVSYLLEGDFSGHVYEGHLRTPDQTGSRIDFSGESIATYDFSDNLRKFQWGLQAGAEWKAYKHLTVYSHLSWGMNDIFKKDFDTVKFAMYPIFLNIGFGYNF